MQQAVRLLKPYVLCCTPCLGLSVTHSQDAKQLASQAPKEAHLSAGDYLPENCTSACRAAGPAGPVRAPCWPQLQAAHDAYNLPAAAPQTSTPVSAP